MTRRHNFDNSDYNIALQDPYADSTHTLSLISLRPRYTPIPVDRPGQATVYHAMRRHHIPRALARHLLLRRQICRARTSQSSEYPYVEPNITSVRRRRGGAGLIMKTRIRRER